MVLELQPRSLTSGDVSMCVQARILALHNPNPLDGSADFTAGLKGINFTVVTRVAGQVGRAADAFSLDIPCAGPDLRFIPYNGGLGEVQLTWMQQELVRQLR